MQDKHIVIVHKDEDRDLFINKVTYPKTVYHVGDNPLPGEIHSDPKFYNQAFLAKWIIENFDNLPEYVIFSQAIPHDHVHEPVLAIDSTLTGDWGSFAFARCVYDQYSLEWVHTNPILLLAEKFGINFTNCQNIAKPLFITYPGEIMFISKRKILEKGKDFFQKIIDFSKDEVFFSLMRESQHPTYFWRYLYDNRPELRGLSHKEKVNTIVTNINKSFGLLGWSFESLWFYLLADNKTFNEINESQACLGNKLYFNTFSEKYEDFNFAKSPINDLFINNFKNYENDWFDWNCPNYLKWRETLKEKIIWEGENQGFDGQMLLDYFERIGYKHISL